MDIGRELVKTLAVLTLTLSAISSQAADINWKDDLGEAQKQAKQYRVPLLIHFSGDNCLPCRLLEQRVFPNPEVTETLNQFFLCVEINATRDPQMATRYGVHSWPTDVFVAHDGTVLYRGVSPQSVSAYMQILKNVAIMNRDRNVLVDSQPKPLTSGVSNQMIDNSIPAQSNPADLQIKKSTQTVRGRLASGPSSIPALTSATQGTAAAQASLAKSSSLPQGTRMLGAPAGRVHGAGLNASVDQRDATTQLPMGQQSPSSPLGQSNQTRLVGPLTSQASVIAGASPNSGTQIDIDAGLHHLGQHTTHLGTQSRVKAQPVGVASAKNSVAAGPNNAEINLPPAPVNRSAGQTVNALVAATPSVPPETQASTAVEPHTPNAMFTRSAVNASKVVSFKKRERSLDVSSAGVDLEQIKPGMDGYCPVSLVTRKSWSKGTSNYAVKHLGQVYWLVSREAAQQFIENPDRYAPVLGGYDPQIFLRQGKFVKGNIRFGGSDSQTGRTILFASQESKDAFRDNCSNKLLSIDHLLRQASGK